MSQLLDLPNELLQDIIHVVHVDDIEAFTSCNKLIHALSRDVLQRHREMKMKYSTIRCTSKTISHGVMDVRLYVHPVTWLYEIISDGTVASYPMSLIIHDKVDHRTTPWPGYDPLLEYPASDTRKRVEDQIKFKLEQCPYIEPKDMDLWLRRPPWLYFDTALSLLLSLLPNLQSILTGHIGIELPRTQYMLARIATANQEYSHENPLSRLFSIDQYQEAGPRYPCKKLDLYLSFIEFPSIRSISGDFVHGYQEWTASAIARNYPPSKANSRNDSKITEIKFTRSTITSVSFEIWFSRINALQKFEYEHQPSSEEGLGTFEICRIVASLQDNASHSLVHLDLTVITERPIYLHGQAFIGPLRRFQVLKTIRTNDKVFIERFESPASPGKILRKTHRLVDLLPKSIEDLQLLGIQINPDVHTSGIFDGLVELKTQNLPNLKAIKLDYFDPVAPDLKTACLEVGVDLTFVDKEVIGNCVRST
ncbi:hypothetical protein BDR22DRAFT_401355 [Usnea florida]